MILYVKAWCPWCHMAEAVLKKHGIAYQRIDVRTDAAAYDEMKRVSGQSRAPTLVAGDRVLADFGPEELEEFLKELNVPALHGS
jgi:glutaredoxin 3